MMVFRLLLAAVLTSVAVSEQRCERLKASLTYTQEQAPRDLSGVLPVVVERVNRELEGVVDVEVEWTGSDLHGRVGDHIIQCKVTRLVSAVQQKVEEQDITLDEQGRQAIVQCFQLPFSITDTNECTLPKGHAMRHKCREPSICANTIGSYECLCPRLGQEATSLEVGDEFWNELKQQQRTPWEISYSSSVKTSCPSSPSTRDCCSALAHSSDGKTCRSAFACPPDPCMMSTGCASNAQCVRQESPHVEPNYLCQCAKGLMGNGHKCKKGDPTPRPMVKFDGVTPTEETMKNDYFCGCTKPEVDACAGFPPCKGNHEVCIVSTGNTPMCACKPGYVNNQDGYGCVDESPPVLKLRPVDGQVMKLKQGDFYKEHAVDIVDENAEEYLRSLRISYSKPLPPGCLFEMGEFHVNYTVATPWTSYQFVRVTRRVIVDDIDECKLDVQKYSESCPVLIPQCDTEAGAKCANTMGSYECVCPKHTSGDGFKTIAGDKHPAGYEGGTGCVDTSKPIIKILGPNPKVLKMCKCGGLAGIMGGGNQGDADEEQACTQQRKKYGSNLKDLIVSTSGAELCATHRKPAPKPKDCVRATDNTFKGEVDVTSRVVVGDPVEKSPLHWSVPYDVTDAAGNKAATAWRDVIVEEVDIFGLEDNVRREVLAEKDNEIQDAVKKAVAEERARIERENPKKKNRNAVADSCPACPKCNCERDTRSSSSAFDKSMCDKYCEEKYAGQCSNVTTVSFFDELEAFLRSNVVIAIVGVLVTILVIRFILTLLFNPRALFGRTDYNYPVMTGDGVVVTTQQMMTPNVPPPPRQPSFSDPASNGGMHRRVPETGGLFSPPENRRYNSAAPVSYHSSAFDDSIYAEQDIITPGGTSKRGRR